MMSSLDLFVDFADKLDSGELDTKLSEIRKLVEARYALTKQKVKIDDFAVGDRISINDRCGTKYLLGELGTVTDIRRTKIKITFDNPKGRFARTNSAGQTYSAEVIVPLEIVDKI
jgi:hypothetical protein